MRFIQIALQNNQVQLFTIQVSIEFFSEQTIKQLLMLELMFILTLECQQYLDQALSSGNSLVSNIKIIIAKMSSTRIFLLFILLFAGSQAQNCPQLCLNCTATGCSSCANSFSLTANVSSICSCPTSTYLDTSYNLCVPCPVTCVSCVNYQKCARCIDGFTLNNSFACQPLMITETGWTNKNVSYQLNSVFKTATNLNVLIGKTQVIMGDAVASSKNCSKLNNLEWFGGQGVFGYNAKLIKTIYGLSPHQWVQIRFQIVLIDRWNGNSLLVQDLSDELFSSNIISNYSNNSNSSTLPNGSKILWSDSFSSANRFKDFCGDASIPDNLAIVDLSASHQASALRIRIRMGDSQTPYNINSTLNQAFFAIRQLFVRVGTCGRYCLACINPNTCTKCLSPYSLINGSCTCNYSLGFNTGSGCQSFCPPGYFLNQTIPACKSCEYITENCRLCNSNSCLSCEIGFFSLKISQAVSCVPSCPTGFSETRLVNRTISSSGADFCSPCIKNCAKCVDQLCILCMSGYLFYQNQCIAICPTGTFPSFGSCIPCHSACSSCSGIQTCLACKQGFGLSNQGKCNRLCANSTALASSSGCGMNCSSPCSICYGNSPNQCLSCVGSLLLQENKCVSSCSVGFFRNNITCQPCAYGCFSCSSAQVCYTCTAGYHHFENKCIRKCPPSTFPTINLDNNSICSPCPNGCLKCSKDLCFNCQEGLILFNSSCLSTIPDGFYYSLQFQHFKACQSNCLACNGLVCSRCSLGHYLDQGVCVISCPNNKYPFVSKANDNSTYHTCRWKCPTCEKYDDGFNNSCAICSLFEVKLYLQGGKCTYNCPQSSTMNMSSNELCLSCPSNCKKCIANQCIQCISSHVISPDLTSCILNNCPQGYFTDSLQCLPCVDGCSICQIDGRCRLCSEGFTLNTMQGICFSANCTLLTFSNNAVGTCQSCISPCRTCARQATTCTSCDPVSNFPILYQSSCVMKCPNGYFSHTESKSCRKCNPKCSSCTSLHSCQQCIAGYSLLSFYNPNEAECIAECPIGFWSDLKKCQSCFKDCKSCWGPSDYQCLSCYPNFSLDEFKCVWQCSPGKYPAASGYCQWCEPGCSRCTGPTIQNCLSCSTGQFLSDSACYSGECPAATYLAYPQQRICQQCQFGCYLCTSPHFCRYCIPGYSLYEGWCYKECPSNTNSKLHRFLNLQGSYYNIQGYICSQCLTVYTDKCLQCTRESCVSCKAGYYLYKQSQNAFNNLIQQCLVSCPSGTYLKNDGQPECMPCSSGCINCTTYSSCIKCSNGLHLINGYCSSSCPSGSYLNSSQSCSSCPINCASCTNALTCTSCNPQFFLFHNSTSGNKLCTSTCPPTFYPDESGWCRKCLPTCASCASSSSCLNCLSGFILSSTGICTNQSTTCPTNCESCSGQNCLRCNSPYLLITLTNTAVTTSSCVLTCPLGYYSNAFTCEICSSGCTACINTANNCTSCVTGLYLLEQKCISNCPVGYYASITSLVCQPCSANCINCQFNNCIICQKGYYLFAGSCYATCPSGTYLSTSNLQCYACPSQCSSCNSDQNCTSCISPNVLFQGSCVKNCPLTAYLQQNQCVQCVAPCLACSSLTKCLSCLPNFILNGTECQSECQQGFFKQSMKVNYNSQIANLDLSTLTVCIRCDQSCATCMYSSTNCQSCVYPYILYGSMCLNECPSTTYLSNGVCRACSPYCAVCVDFNQCLACVNVTTLFANQCYSACPPGYQMSSQVNSTINSYICQQCSSSCLTCRGSSPYDCLSCNTGYFWLNGSSCVSTCPVGLYSNSNSQSCLPCPYGCASCVSPNNCTTCINNFVLSSTRICQGNSSTCNSSNCLNCLPNNSSRCAQCNTGYNLYQGVCYSSCPTSTYSNYGKCIPCFSGCLTCSQHRCLTCNSSLILYQGICISSCPTGTIMVNSTCTNDLCLSKSPSGDCQLCISPYLLYNSSSDDNQQGDSGQQDSKQQDSEQDDSKNILCIITCPSGTFQTGGACVKCPSKCRNCISSSQCIQCRSQASLYNGKCYEDCPKGTYKSANRCINCTLSYCSKCYLSTGVEKCQECDKGAYLYNSNCVITCPTGTYLSSTSEYCRNCPQNCQVCASDNSCSACRNGTVLYNGRCLSNCPTGTYLSSNTCKQCQSGCMSCQSISNCLNCLPNFILYSSSNTSSCLSSCPIGFYSQSYPSIIFSNSNQQKCTQCISPCLTCTSSSSCTNCQLGFSLIQNKCLNVCPSGYFSIGYQIVLVGNQTTETSRCVPCSPICQTCSGVSNNCSSCPSGYILASNTCVSNCSSSSIGYYYNSATRNCNKCSVACYSCSGPQTSNCLSCVGPLQLFAGSCLSTCPFGYYPTPALICQPCAPKCASCSGSALNCTLCSSPLSLQVSNSIGSCIQSCLAGNYASNGNCQPCNSKCLTCSGPADSQCLSCKLGLFLVNQSCIQLCPIGTTAMITTNQNSCISCNTNCISCFYQSSSQKTQCSQCAAGYYLTNGVCTLSCPTGTYPSPVTYSCDNCNLAGCIKCVLSPIFTLTCTQCQAGYYLYNSSCLSSCPNDTILSGSECVPKPVCTKYQWNGFCLDECPSSTFSTSTSTVINGVTVLSLSCTNCSIYCQQCSSEINCAACISGTFLILRNSSSNSSYQCVNQCPTGFYQTSRSCITCPSPCANCRLTDSGVICLSCLPGFLQMGSLCVSSCPTGYFSSSGSCSLCSAICYSCIGSGSNCTLCKNTNNFIPSCNTSAINCTLNQYLSSASNCANCHNTCVTCFGGSNSQCSSCASNLILVFGSCIANCPAGTIRSGTTCVNCPSNCLNCSLTGATALCNTCASPYILVPSTGTCIIDCSYLNSANSSFILINGSCLLCNITGCSSCILSNGSPSCLACKNGSILYNQVCYSTCPLGSVANYAIGSCVPCSSNCATCSNIGCILCATGYYNMNGLCVQNCGSGYYIANSACNKCTIANCITCTSTSCTSCQQPYTLNSLNFGQCTNCIAGYVFQGGLCQLCSSPCATCSGSSTNCTTCKIGYYIFNSICSSVCPTGYFGNSGGICAICTVSNCKECTSNGCSACQTGFVTVITSGVISCQTACPTAAYLDSTTNICYNCSSGCTSCLSTTFCNVCNLPLVLYQGYCLSKCPQGLYNSNGTCWNCPNTCKTCSSPTNCSTCSSIMIISNGTCILPINNCSTGYYKNALGSCEQCFTSCKSCQGQSSSDCLSCFNGYYLSNGVCIQNCNSTSFYNTNTSSCSPCTTLATNCLSCNSSSCLVCNTNFIVLNGKCTQFCPVGTFLNNNNCLPCSSYCTSCNSESICNQCLNTSFIIVNGKCVSECPQQTYLKNGQCVACYQTCLTCLGISTNCSSCLSPYFLHSSKCVSSCPNGTYEDISHTCQNCSSNCKLCSSASSCEQCNTNYYLINGTCRSSCPAGYYIDTSTNRCIECLYPCLSCTARNNCLSCASPAVLSNSMCINSNCSGGYFDFSLNNCRNCTVNNCAYCTNSSCSYCKNGYYSVYSSSLIVYCQSNCPDGTYKDSGAYNCSSCFSNCKLCQNGSWCNSCLQGYFLLTVERSSVNECVDTCPQGYYASSSICKSCRSNCIICTNSQSCVTCKPDYFLLTTGNSSKCVQNCPIAYFTPSDLTGNGQCGPCSSNCLSCYDLTACTQCDSGFKIFNGVCVPSNCVNCLTCNYTSNICITCDSDYYLMDSACVKTCPDYYFGNNSTRKCQKCIDNCLVCGDKTSCYICISGYEYINGTGCQNSGFIKYGALGNMSGFTSNITQIMAMVFVTTSTGPIAFGAVGPTYGLMQLCQILYLMKGSTDNNEQMNTFLNSLSATSYTTNSETDSANTQTSSISSKRLLAAVDYTSNFFETNLPIFLMMIAFISAYVLVLLFEKYQGSCCLSCPNLLKYISYTCQFMKMRFKYIYVDTVMWISYLPFLYFSILQLKKGDFSTGINVFSSLLAIVIIVIYPLYPLFILRKLFDRSQDPEENLKNYKAITLLEPQVEKSMCADFTCCPKKEKLTYQEMVQKNKLSMVQMSLSPYIEKVKRPVYNENMEGYNEFKYFKKQHWVLAYAAIKYFRRFLIALVVAICESPSATLAIVATLIVCYMVYLIALKPKEKLYLVLQIILQSVLLFFILMMLIYVSIGGATVTAMSVVTHAVGFIIANSSLLIAIILNIMSYYTIFCCIYDLIQHLKNKVIEEEQKEKHFDQMLEEKDKIHIDDIKDKDKEDIQLKIPKRGDDEQTEENNDEPQHFDNFQLDQKQFIPGSKVIKKKTFGDDEDQDFSNLKSTTKGRRDKRRAERKKSRHLEEESHTSQEIMAHSKLSTEQLHQIQDGLLKQKDNKFRRDVNNKDINVIKGQIRDPTDRFKRHSKKLPAQQQQSMDTLNIPHAKEEIIMDIRTQDRLINNPKLADREKINKNDELDLENINMRQREKNKKGLNEVSLYEKQGKNKKQGENQADLPEGKFANRNNLKKDQPFGQFDQFFAKEETNIKDAQFKQRQAKNKREAKKIINQEIMDIDTIDRVQKARKQENKLYKGSDEQVNIEQGQARQVKNKFRNEGKRKNLPPSQQPEININAYGKDITTKKAEKLASNREFAEDNQEQLTYKERQGRKLTKEKQQSNNPRLQNNLNEAQTYNREKKTIDKKQKIQQNIPQQNLLSVGFKEVEKRKSSKEKNSIYDNLDNDLTQSIEFGDVSKPPARKGVSRQQEQFEESQMGKVGAAKTGKNKSGNGRLDISENLQESYEDTIKKNKQQMFKQTQENKSRMMEVSEDPFEQVEYQRPESKMERPSSRSKDLGLGINSRQGSQASDDQSRDVRRRKNSALQRIRKRGQLSVNQNDDKDNQDNVGSDSRRVSRIAKQKSKLKGVLNIDDKSQNEDIEEMRL